VTGTDGKVNAILGPLNINAGTGVGTDTLQVDDTSDTAANTGSLTPTGLVGLGMGTATISNVEILLINLGRDGDTFTVNAAAQGPAVTIAAGPGKDIVSFLATSVDVTTTINAGADPDTIRVGSASGFGGIVDNIRGPLRVNAGAQSDTLIDTLIIDDVGDSSNNTGSSSFTDSTRLGSITGLDMTGGGITFNSIETVNIRLGRGNDTFRDFIQFVTGGVRPRVFLDTGLGEDGLLFFGTPGNDVIHVSRQIGLEGPEAVEAINRRRIVTGYANGETITILAGNGNDSVTMAASAAFGWKALFIGEGGNDHLIGSLRDDVLRGGDGNDRLEGGAGDDQLRGGNGSDRLDGGAGNDQLHGGDGSDWLQGKNGDDVLIGGRGHDVFRGGAGSDLIIAADGLIDDVFADDNDRLGDLDLYDVIQRKRRKSPA
jgi:Ca2+-binding RTX toxin-like protein